MGAMKKNSAKKATINGSTLRQLIAARGVQQNQLAEQVGVTKFRISQLAKRGNTNHVLLPTARAMAKALGVTVEALASDSMESAAGLTPDEAAVLELYRQLGPIERAQALVKMHAIAQNAAEKDGD